MVLVVPVTQMGQLALAVLSVLDHQQFLESLEHLDFL